MGMQTESYNATRINASTAIKTTPALVSNLLCTASSAGIIKIRDGGITGTILVNDLPVVAGSNYPLPMATSVGLYVELVSGTFDGTLFWA